MISTCLVCGKLFEGCRSEGLCSEECVAEHRRRKSRARAVLNRKLKTNERRCPDCGRIITDYRCPKCWAKRGRPADMGGMEEYL